MKLRIEIIYRLLIFILIGLITAALFSEIAFRLQGVSNLRSPQTILLVIPAGTADKVAQGHSVVPTGQVFVVGDILEVQNEDSVTQTLGPLVIPPGTSASMKLEQAGNLSYTCSFQPTKYYGIEVQQALTIWMRLEATLLAGLPLGVLMGVYSLVIRPVKPKINSLQK